MYYQDPPRPPPPTDAELRRDAWCSALTLLLAGLMWGGAAYLAWSIWAPL